MGDHVCGSPEPAREVPPGPDSPHSPTKGSTPPPESHGILDRMSSKQNAKDGARYQKPGRALPPKVDTHAANRQYYGHDELTPVSPSPPPGASPMSPGDGQRAPFGSYHGLRSTTLTIPRASPSPESLSSNMDSSFPPFKNSALVSPRNAKGGGSSGKGTPDSIYAPVSPRTTTAGGLLQRMETIAPGPFDGRMPSSPGYRENGTAGSLTDITLSNKTYTVGESVAHPSAAGGPGGHSRTSTNGTESSHGSRSGIVAPRQPRKKGYGGFGAPLGDDGQREPLSHENRSQTFPSRNESQDELFRRPSDPRSHHPSNDGGRSGPPATIRKKPSMSGPDRSRAPPPQGVSLIRPRQDSRLGDKPLVPSKLNLAAEFGIGNPYHTSNESSSSNTSGYSDHSIASSHSSPPRSVRRQPPDGFKMDHLIADLENSISDLEPKKLPDLPPPSPQRNIRTIPNKTKDRPGNLSPSQLMDLAIQQGKARLSPAPLTKRPPSPFEIRPGEPAIPRPSTSNTNRSLSPAPLAQRRPSSPLRSRPQESNFQQFSTANTNRSLSPAPLAQRRPPSPFGHPQQRPSTANSSGSLPSVRPDTGNHPASSKGNCKGCSLPIKGRSVSSADGRLTGRYHKHCFVCATCFEPFQTATFYVINDAPYCERHYHKLNGSVCKSCDRGIEGQYLESERREKFHPRCLTCADCRRSLKNDYFEINGRAFCERDAFRRAQQGRSLGPGGGWGETNRMERRTTRLMMM
ncbi:hypothetical protein LZ554_001541 [Drepanopeziza brunnea f. sp. 'monogermtubi']|nr:hypothetical protein LZ554_001541 [Drepanopeziza brunnea f. sp. 'monogermtubi']